jgi:asparagine synthase (glutamine-hydrolysing)
MAASRLRVPWASSRISRVYQFVVRPIAVHATPRTVRRILRHRRARGHVAAWAGPVLRDVLRAGRPETTRDFAPATPAEAFARLSDTKYAIEVSDGQCALSAEMGIPMLTPYHDEELVSFVASLPPESLLAGGYLRGLFRQAFKGIVPDSVRLRTDKADFEPAIERMHAPIGGRAAFARFASVPALGALGVIDPPAYKAAFDSFARGETGGEGWFNLWPILSIEAFAQQALKARGEGVSP